MRIAIAFAASIFLTKSGMKNNTTAIQKLVHKKQVVQKCLCSHPSTPANSLALINTSYGPSSSMNALAKRHTAREYTICCKPEFLSIEKAWNVIIIYPLYIMISHCTKSVYLFRDFTSKVTLLFLTNILK